MKFRNNDNLNECVPTTSALLNMSLTFTEWLCGTSASNLYDEEKKHIKTEQNAGGTMTKMTDEKEGWLFLTGCG